MENEYLYGCSVTKLDADLNILAAFDPGDPSCYYQPYTGANADSVSGEVVPDGAGVWAQYVRPNDADMKTVLYRLDLNLQEQCRVEFPFEPQTQTVGFYAAPTVDKDGNAYVIATVPDGQNTRRGQLLRVTPDCQTTLLAEAPGSWAHASPTLADDQYVLFATDGKLQILTLDGQPVKGYALASDGHVLGSPVIQDGVIYVVQEDGTLNIIENSGVSGYGTAVWPRYRHDNMGSAALALILLPAALLTVWIGGRIARNASASLHWPQTAGEITRSEIRAVQNGSDTTYYAHVAAQGGQVQPINLLQVLALVDGG